MVQKVRILRYHHLILNSLQADLADSPSELASSSLHNGRYMDEEDDLYFDIGTPLVQIAGLVEHILKHANSFSWN